MSVIFASKTIKCGNEHSPIILEPPKLAVQSFHSWNQRAEIEVFGGQGGRPAMVHCWIHDNSFSSSGDIEAYLKILDIMAGDVGTLRVTTYIGTTSFVLLDNVRFMGFRRLPFPGREYAHPIQAIGTFSQTYGDWHCAGELWFYQIRVW